PAATPWRFCQAVAACSCLIFAPACCSGNSRCRFPPTKRPPESLLSRPRASNSRPQTRSEAARSFFGMPPPAGGSARCAGISQSCTAPNALRAASSARGPPTARFADGIPPPVLRCQRWRWKLRSMLHNARPRPLTSLTSAMQIVQVLHRPAALFVALWLFLIFVSVFDGYLILRFRDELHKTELNPLGRLLIQLNGR